MRSVLEHILSHSGHLDFSNSYWKNLTPEFARHLESYLTVFENYRSDSGKIPSETVWKQLPKASGNDWKWRRESQSLLEKIVGNEMAVLEIGAWNGWLTKTLARNAKTVIATDYFTAAYDGIGNIGSFAQNIIPLQCNLETIAEDFKPESFDLIVLNHCLSYMKNPPDYLKNLVPLLKPDGKIISLGNTFYRDPKRKIAANKAEADEFSRRYGIPLYIAPVKGYMDSDDREFLKESGFEIIHYPGKLLQNLRARLNPSAPVYAALAYNAKHHAE